MAIRRGEVYFVNFNPAQGREQAGPRPVLVLSIDAINRLPLVVTVVIGTKGENVTRRTFASRQQIAVCQWKRFSFVSNCVRWIQAVLGIHPQGESRVPRCKKLKSRFGIVSDCRSQKQFVTVP